MDGAKAVKRHNAQYDIFNRLHSIAADQWFVEQVSKEWFEGRFEVVRKALLVSLYFEGGG
jgi:tRNA A64-2'-O-ribosylphosphate transferase